MSDFLQAHRRFFIGYAVGALVFLLVWLIIGSMFNDAIALNRRNEARFRREASERLPAGVDLRSIQAKAREMTAASEDLVRSLARKPAQRFTLADAGNPDLHYNRLIEELQLDVVERCALRSIGVDESIGRPDGYPSTTEDFAWYLRGFDIVHQVLNMVIDADDVFEGGIVRVDRIEIEPPPRARRRGVDAPFLSLFPVRFRMVAHPRSIALLLEQVARKRTDGQGLVLSEFEMRSLDLPEGTRTRPGQRVDPRDADRVEVRLRLASVDIDPAGRVEGRGGSR